MHITSSSPLLTATFPGQHDLFRAGDAIDLTAHLELALDNKGQSKLERVTAELRGTQITTYYASRPNPGPVGAQRRVGESKDRCRSLWLSTGLTARDTPRVTSRPTDRGDHPL